MGFVTDRRYPWEASVCRGVFIDKGLIGFDVETGCDILRPELLRLVKRGNQTTADSNEQFALAA